MADQPIGVSFIPTDENQANGSRQAQIEGAGGSDLTQAFKILSLHLPRVLGAGAIVSPRLANSPGAAGVKAFTPPGGDTSGGVASPYSAVFQALLQSMTGGMRPSSSLSDILSGAGPSGDPGGDPGGPPSPAPIPKVIFTDPGMTRQVGPDQSASPDPTGAGGPIRDPARPTRGWN